jgi:hypothetical protein
MGRFSRTEITRRLTEESREPESISRHEPTQQNFSPVVCHDVVVHAANLNDKETNRMFLGTNDDLRRLECSFRCRSADDRNLMIAEALEEPD